MEHYPQADNEHDIRQERSVLTQPWREWWPEDKQTREACSKYEKPWNHWIFNHSLPFEKPWVDWPMTVTPDYNPITGNYSSIHDESYIQETLQKQGPDPRLDPTVPRTTSFLLFFANHPDHPQEKPYVSKIPPPSNTGRSQLNFGGQYHQVMLTDISGHEKKFTLDIDGFEYVPGAYQGSTDNFDVPTYIESMSTWLKEYLGGSEVFVFDYTMRHEQSRIQNLKGFSDVARRVHCDQTPRSSIGRIKLHMGSRADELLKGRCRMINIWRPLVPVVKTYPLAACSYKTTVPESLVAVDVVFPHFAEEAFEILPSAEARWYFRSDMTWRDVALLKVFDNKVEDNVAYMRDARLPPSTGDSPEPLPKSVEAFDNFLEESVGRYVRLSNELGGAVARQAVGVLAGFKEQRRILLIASKTAKPDASGWHNLTRQMSYVAAAVVAIQEASRGDSLHRHLSCVADGIPMLSWIEVELRAFKRVDKFLGHAQYFGNKLLTQYKEK
ncbi:hypothetical protein SCAR479_04669 [Seiridium cardinale]|uniref:CAP N-terminal domain-containing protein n=1 Tax=Seiridium cardinale TaxID=138064 RepID=A0ABR2XY12_9PEZI